MRAVISRGLDLVARRFDRSTPAPATTPITLTSTASGAAALVDYGRDLDLLVFDGDRQVVGMLTRLWRSLRLRGIEGRSALSLRQATERAALLSYAATAAGVRTPPLLSVSEAEDSMFLLQTGTDDAVPLSELDGDDVDDDVLREIWAQLRLAHKAGIAHRVIHTHPANHVGYYPGAESMSLKLIVAVDDARILGAQAVGGAVDQDRG